MTPPASPGRPEGFQRLPLAELVAHLARVEFLQSLGEQSSQEKLPPELPAAGAMPPLTIELRTTFLTADDDETFLPQDHPDIDIPDVTLEAFLGGGKQGWVYSGRVASTGALVAVKVLQGSYVQAGGRAVREALNLGRLRHPNIPRVFQFQPSGRFWVVIMELVQGQELRTCRLAGPQIKRCFGRLADAVWTLSQMEMVHRDIKPANIVLRRHDHSPVLVDFGLAVDLSSPLPLKAENWLAGTPLFMPGHAFSGAAPDIGWDAYALGMTAADVLLEGRYPRPQDFTGLVAAKVGGDFERGVLEALAKEPDTALRDWCTTLLSGDTTARLAALHAARSW